MSKKFTKMNRLCILATMLQKHVKVTTSTYIKELKKQGCDDNISTRTARRDIEALKNEYDAPIEYDASRGTQYLTEPWELNAISETEIASSIISAQIAKNILPNPVSGKITNNINEMIATMGTGDLESTMIDSMIVASKTKVTIDPEIFSTIFNAWRQNHAIDITYKKSNGETKKHRVDPHIVAYSNYIWYIKGECHTYNDIRVFAIHRIIQCEDTNKFYEPNEELINSVEKNGLFNFPRIENVKVRCNKDSRGYILEQAEANNHLIEELENEELLVTIPSVIEHDLMHWVLGEGGRVEIIEPESLRIRALEAGKALVKVHSP